MVDGRLGADHTGDEVAGKRPHDHDRAGADQAHRHRVGELLLGQPVMVGDQPLVKKRYGCEALAERECTRLREEDRHSADRRTGAEPG